MSTRARDFLDQCDKDFKRVLMMLYIERQPLHEFSKLLAEALEKDQIVIVPIRREEHPDDQDQEEFDPDR